MKNFLIIAFIGIYFLKPVFTLQAQPSQFMIPHTHSDYPASGKKATDFAAFRKLPETNKIQAQTGLQKPDSNITSRWDTISGLWVNEYKNEYLYDSKGNLTVYIAYNWEFDYNKNTFGWIPENKGENTYNQIGQYTLGIGYRRIDNSGQLVKSSKDEIAYDAYGNMILFGTYQMNDTSGNWVGGSKEKHSYDSKKHMTLYIKYGWDYTVNYWAEVAKGEFTYDSRGNMVLSLSYNWDKSGNKWVAAGKGSTNYIYTPSGGSSVGTWYVWNTASGKWLNYTKEEKTFDANGDVTSGVYYTWDETSGKWVGNLKNECTYIASSKFSLLIVYLMNTNSRWIENHKIEKNYNSNNQEESWIWSDWDTTYNQWVPVARSQNTYDETGNNTSTASYYWNKDTGQWTGNTEQVWSYNAEGNIIQGMWNYRDTTSNQWIAASKLNYYYSDHDIVAESPSSKINIYPNPVSDILTFEVPDISESATVEIFDSQGNKTLDQKLSITREISIQHLAAGIYLYRVKNNGLVYTGKFVVVHKD